MNRREYWAWLSTVEGMYCQKITKLLNVLRTPEQIYNADEKILLEKVKLTKEDVYKIKEAKEKFNSKDFFEKLKKLNVEFVSVDDKEYPRKLIPYNEKPYYLFYKGKLPDEKMPIVAMIGARACSDYGRNIARKLAREMSQKGVQIISGMARGIDTYSAIGALEGKGQTFAVLGCGVDICYPIENIELYEKIIKNGGIISEYPPKSEPLTWHFPQRNRIISGLSDKIVVVEAKEKSGSLITVEWGLEQGKDIMAVPGKISEKLSGGCNRLIKAGAGIITSTNDIVEELFPDYKYEVFKEGCRNNIEEKLLEKDLGLLYSELSLQPKSVYDLMKNTGLDYSVIAEKLLQLQLMGLIEQTSTNYFSRLD